MALLLILETETLRVFLMNVERVPKGFSDSQHLGQDGQPEQLKLIHHRVL